MRSLERTRVIERVSAEAPGMLRVKWRDGPEVDVDLSRDIGRLNALRSLRNPAVFARAVVGEWGHSVEWPDDVEIGSGSLWRDTLSAIGRDDTRGFLEWRLENGLSLSAAAAALGVSRRAVAYYSNGDRPVPRPIQLACRGWEALQAAA